MNEPNPADGVRLLTIGGFATTKGVGRLWQDFSTSPGQTYSVSYAFGRGNNDPTAAENVSVQVSIFDLVSGTPSGLPVAFDNSGNAPTTGSTSDLISRGFQFTALGNSSRIFLQDTSGGPNQGVELDAISVMAVPEPSTAVLLGVGLLGVLYRLRRRN